jgi:deazaflavin-dependent oxidoreductase (nitroreductase family)
MSDRSHESAPADKEWEPMTSLDLTVVCGEHVRRYQQTDGEYGHLWNGLPCLVLTTTRESTGAARDTALFYGVDGEDFVVVGSKGGLPHHPFWYLDLLADPNVRLQVGAARFAATARTATPAERQHYLDIMLAVWPPYEVYLERARPREIPVVVITPSDDAAPDRRGKGTLSDPR